MAVPDAPRLRHRWSIVAACTVLVSLAACNGSVPDERVQRNKELAAELARDLESSGRFTQVFVGYADDAANDRALGVEITCTSCSPAASLNDALEAAWKSPITPVHTFQVSVSNTETLQQESRYVRDDQDRAEMVRRYGERPVGR
jgi:hypothetical protein